MLANPLYILGILTVEHKVSPSLPLKDTILVLPAQEETDVFFNWLSCPQACRWQRTVAPCLKMLNQGGKQRGRVIYAPNITEGGTISPTKFKVNS